MIKDRIVARYGERFLRKSALSIRDGEGVFREVLGDGRYRTALEIGTYKGVSAACMAQFCERVITIDLKRGKLEMNGEDHDRAWFWGSLGIDNIEFHAVADDAEKAQLINGMEFDFAFIDGAHDAFGVRADFDLVKRCGAVLFHDYDDSGPKLEKRNDVYRFVNTLPKGQLRVIDIFALWTA